MMFGGIQKLSTIDFPKTLCCVLFTRGCDMDCFYCHNRALLTSAGPTLAYEEAMAFLEKRKGLLDGVVVSGGEPTLQEGLTPFFRALKGMGYRTKLDTNGQHPEAVQALLMENLLDYAAVDVKANAEDYTWVCRCHGGYAKAMETILLLQRHGLAFEARCTLYPGMDIEALAHLLGALPKLPCLRLNFFRMPEEYKKEDRLLLRRTVLTEQAVLPYLEELRALQPNLLF